ncbi:hypothetical protein ACA910_011253 [Epithemia clementina (nom. ined.)]
MWWWSTTAAVNMTANWIGVGFGTAALHDSYQVVTMALEEGFRRFDTAEADVWYNQAEVGRALHDFFTKKNSDETNDDICMDEYGHLCGEHNKTCGSEDLRISTKIPPWSLTSHYDIRKHAAESRQELLGFCEHWKTTNVQTGEEEIRAYPLDVYFIHAPACWNGWHPKCQNPPPTTLDLKNAWLAMEDVVHHDRTARRIGLSNVHADELRDLIHWIQERQSAHDLLTQGQDAAVQPVRPRLPDAVQIYADPIHPAEDVRQICRDHGIEFVSYSTLGTQHRRSSSAQGTNPVLDSPVIQELAAQYKRSTAEIVLQWARQHGMSVIPRSNKRQHIQELARLLQNEQDHLFQLEPQDMIRIDSLKNSV